MVKKLIAGLTLLLVLSLISLMNSFVNVLAAGNVATDKRIELSPPTGMLMSDEKPAAVLVNQQSITQTVYLPLVLRGFCSDSLSYNETIRYNLVKIKAEAAWGSCYYGKGIIVAVVDSGIDLTHSDLEANIVTGKSFVSGVSSADDDYGHGTHVAGIIAGVNNNGGIIGVAPKASLMPVKVLNSYGKGSIYDVADGIEWAADHGAEVINLSLGTVSSSTTLKEAVDYAYNQGVLLVASAGNCGDSAYYSNGCYYQDQPSYPAAYTNVMAVASTDSSDNQSSFSTQGSYIEIAAPGSSIYSTYLSGGYTTMSGTSMAAPHVAGLAALIWSQNSDLTNQEVRAQIRNTALDLGDSGWDSQFGYGRINAYAAMGSLQTTSTSAADKAGPTEPVATADAEAPYVPGEVLLKLQTGFTVDNVIDPDQLSAAEVKVADTIDQIGVQKLSVITGQEQALLAQLLNSTGVEYAELNYVVTAQ